MNYFDILLAKKLEDDRDPKVEGLSVTENGRYHEDGVVYDPVIVALPLDDKTITQNGIYLASDDNLEGYDEVIVDVPLPENAYLLKDIPNTPTAIATFSDGANLPMPKLEIGIEPMQSGSGDPSPTNIRPISGWDEVNVSVRGVNVWNESYRNGYYTSTGEYQSNDNCIANINPINVKENTSYFLYYDFSRYVNGMRVIYMDSNLTFISKQDFQYGSSSFTTPSNCYYINICTFTAGSTGGVYNNDISINYPSTDTTYHAYNGHTYTIDLDGTRYGCTLDVVSGELVVDRITKIFDGSENWQKSTSGNMYYLSTDSTSFPYIENHTTYNKANIYKFKGFTTGSYFIFLNDGEYLLYRAGSGTIREIAIKNLSISTVEDFKTSLSNNNLQVQYEITPQTIQLTPTAVKSLLGSNNVWGDSGNILDLSYLSKEG